MRYLLFIILLTLFTAIKAQNPQKELIELDAVIGNNISLKEKIDYYLFEFVDTVNYNYSQVFNLNDSTYLLEVSLLDSTQFDTIINQTVVDLNKENIYYMKGYFEAKRKQQENHQKEVDSLILTTASIYQPQVNGKLIVKNKNNWFKLRMKEGKYYHFKIKKKYDDAITISLTGVDERYLGYIYAQIEKVLLIDSTIVLRRLNKSYIVKFDEIECIKQNTLETLIYKSMGSPAGNVFIYPLFPLSTPICVFNLIFNKKKFDLTTNSEFRIKNK